MPEVNQTISQGLANQLASLSQAAADYKADPKANKASLEATAARTLAQIDAEIGSLNVSSGQFAQTIKELIRSGDWAKLPPPKQMEQRAGSLLAVNDAIRDVQDSIIVDISSIMAVLIEIQRKAALSKGEERIQERNATLTSAQAEFKKRATAADEQRTADMVQAGIQIATGILSVVGSSISIAGLKGANTKTAEAWGKSQKLEPGQMNTSQAKKMAAEHSIEAAGAKKIIGDADAKVAAGGTLTAKEQNLVDKMKENLRKQSGTERMATALEDDLKLKRLDIDRLNSEAHETTQMIRAQQDLFQAIGGMAGKSGDMAAAQLKFMSSMSQVAADKEALAKNLAQSGEQAALDAYQQLRDSLKSALQMIQAIEQAMSSSLSSMARSI